VTATGQRDLVIGFLYVGNVSPIPEIMVASVRIAMPGARIVQMTDLDTRTVPGVDDVLRKPWDRKFLMPYRLLHLEEFPAADVIFLDADVVVQRDLRPLFRDEFDVALTYRDETDPSLRKSPEAYQMMPFNTGVMLSRPSGREFWAEAHRACRAMAEERRSWFGDQLAIKEVAARTKLKIRQYPCALYNYSPSRWEEDLSEKFVIHYKGKNRKIWMVERWKHLLRQSG
jgi:lipopolysaccharide biosynthesis glycosyltransferase